MKRGYSLIELGVVLGVIAFIALTTLPTLNATSDSQALQTGATTISRLLLDAKTRSLAPSEVTTSASPAAYQVVFGPFENAAASRTLTGDISVSTIELKSGSAVCEGAGSMSGVKLLRSEKLPRNTYIEKVYPSNATVGGSSATIQFTVGKLGFQCGDVNRPEIESTSYVSGFWEGKNTSAEPSADVISSRYAVITLASTKSAARRYVYIDRQNSEIFVSKEDPQEFFTALGDNLAPQWSDTGEGSFLFSVSCGAATSRVNISFVRAVDYIGENDGDAVESVNAPVYYDISVGGQVVATSYYQAVSGENDVIYYSYDSSQFGTGNFSENVEVIVTAKDSDGNFQEELGNAADQKRTKTFSTNCGNTSTRSITNDFQPTSQNSPEIVNNNNHQSTQQQAGLD